MMQVLDESKGTRKKCKWLARENDEKVMRKRIHCYFTSSHVWCLAIVKVLFKKQSLS